MLPAHFLLQVSSLQKADTNFFNPTITVMAGKLHDKLAGRTLERNPPPDSFNEISKISHSKLVKAYPRDLLLYKIITPVFQHYYAYV